MNTTLTFATIAYEKTYDAEGIGVRRNTSRGVNLPDVLTVRSQSYVDSATKLPGTRFTARIDQTEDVNGETVVVSAYVVLAIPAIATQTRIDAVVAGFKAAIADADFIGDVLNGEK